MSDGAVMKEPYTLEFVPDHFKTKRMQERVIEDKPEALEFVPDHFKMQEICERATEDDLYTLIFVSDWFVTQQQKKSWYDDDYDDEALEKVGQFRPRQFQEAVQHHLQVLQWIFLQ